MTDYPKPPYPAQQQPMPGSTRAMQLRPDHGEQSYKGAGRLSGKKAIITGGDSGIGRAVAIADQAAFDALALTPLRNATVFSLVLAAFSSFKLVVRKRTVSSWPSSSAQAISVP